MILSMVRARWTQAVTVFLLSVVATAAAVAGPAALRVVDAAVVTNEVADSSNAERSISVTGGADPSDPGQTNGFDTVVNLLSLPGFTTIRAGEISAFGPVENNASGLRKETSRLAFRDQLCQHVVIVAGRCLAGPLDVLIGADTARRAGLHAGDLVNVQAEKANPNNGQAEPDGAVATLTVAGIYQPRDPDELYWAARFYFPVRPDGTRSEPMFVTPQTFDLIEHTVGASSADSLIPASSLTPQRLEPLAEQIGELTTEAENDQSGFTVATDFPQLIERIHRGQALAHQLVPVAFLPLVALSWFVVYLAVGYGVNGRRHELGLVNLRGVRVVRRWSLALGETILMILAGAPVGYAVGYLAVDLVSRLGIGGDITTGGFTVDEVPYAAIALGGALLVALAGQRRALREPVVELLRGVPRLGARWQSYVGEGVLVILAALGVVQLRGSDNGLTGTALIVPGLVVVAVALLAARAFVPVAGLLARTSLRRGRLGVGLAAVQIARRPGSQRLFALLAVATGLLVFVTAGQSVAEQAREERANVSVGATTVLTVDPTSTPRLVAATHAVDPDGTWAMAVIPVEQKEAGDPPLLAVDSGRLSKVPALPSGQSLSPGLAAALAAPAGDPLILHSEQFTVDMDRGATSGNIIDSDGDGILDTPPPPDPTPVAVSFRFQSLTGGTAVVSTVTVLLGRRTYTGQAVGCAEGCRLTGISGNAGYLPLRLTIFDLSSAAGDVVSPAAFATLKRWSRIGGCTIGPVSGGGLRLELTGDEFDTGDFGVSTVDAPVPVPVLASTGQDPPRTVTGLDGREVAVKVAGTVAMLPRLGTQGVIVDLSYLERVGLAQTLRQTGEVWLSASAPADAVNRLRTAGLSVTTTTSAAETLAALDRAGPALALRFYLAAAGLGIFLALGGLWLVAAVDRRRRADDLRALRHQGLRPRVVRRAALWGYLWLVLGSAVAGLLSAVAAWAVTGDRLPVLTDAIAALPPPRWPTATAVLLPWVGATAAMIAVAFFVAVALRRTVRLPRSGRE